MDSGGGILRAAVRVVMEPALRLIQGDPHQWSEKTRSRQITRGRGYPTKLTEPRLGCSPPGRRQERAAKHRAPGWSKRVPVLAMADACTERSRATYHAWSEGGA